MTLHSKNLLKVFASTKDKKGGRMACDCYDSIEKRVAEYLNVISVSLGRGLEVSIEGSVNLSHTIPCKYTVWDDESGDEVEMEQPIEINYCPFCGKKFKEEKKGKEAVEEDDPRQTKFPWAK
ncbi:MAG: hypothetical protein ACRDDZ_05955 [Marinifilaceae bacterium]